MSEFFGEMVNAAFLLITFFIIALVLIGASLSAILSRSFSQATNKKKIYKINAIALSLATLLGIFSIFVISDPLIILAGSACIFFGARQIRWERGWWRILPLPQVLLGVWLLSALWVSGV